MFAERLKTLRKSKKITQEKLADIIGVERSSIGKYESPSKPVIPSTDIQIKLADYFNVTVDYLLGREEKPSENSNDLSNKITEMFKRLNDTNQKQALEYLEFLAARDNQEN
ncbi:MAG: helix-turn-helix transcriptional regulator [Clostridia bacterium]|nr:helix-turn-helix transcriptional regulator [Clostridia bacterium]